MKPTSPIPERPLPYKRTPMQTLEEDRDRWRDLAIRRRGSINALFWSLAAVLAWMIVVEAIRFFGKG